VQLAPAFGRSEFLSRAAGILLGVLLLVLFGLGGPSGALGLAALAFAGVGALLLVPSPPIEVVLPASGALLLIPQFSAGIHVFDVVAVLLIFMALLRSLTSPAPAWEIHGPGVLSFIYLLIPLLAVPFTVVSVYSFLGGYKELALPVLLFLSLRRLVSREESQVLLWIFPVAGLTAAVQLIWQTRGLGSRIYERLEFRNFYTNLGWGSSNYIAAILELCLLGTLLLGILDRRVPVRVGLFLASLPMLQAFLVLFSRAGTLGLLVAGLVLAIGLGGSRTAWTLGTIGLAFVVGLATSGGQVIASRFVSIQELGSYYERLMIWNEAWQRFVSHPLTGIGVNQGRYQMDEMGESQAHNLLLDRLMDQGVFSGLLFFVLIYVIYRLSLRAVPMNQSGRLRTIRSAIVALVTGILVHAAFEPTLSGYEMAFLFAWFLAWLTLQDPRAKPATS